MDSSKLTDMPIASVLDYQALLKNSSTTDLKNALIDLRVLDQSTKLRIQTIQKELQKRKEKPPLEVAASNRVAQQKTLTKV